MYLPYQAQLSYAQLQAAGQSNSGLYQPTSLNPPHAGYQGQGGDVAPWMSRHLSPSAGAHPPRPPTAVDTRYPGGYLAPPPGKSHKPSPSPSVASAASYESKSTSSSDAHASTSRSSSKTSKPTHPPGAPQPKSNRVPYTWVSEYSIALFSHSKATDMTHFASPSGPEPRSIKNSRLR
jgi:hypothetical protein